MIAARRLFRSFELPLLVKELNEQAERRRTYLVRFAYAAVLFGLACGIFYGDLLAGTTQVGSLGQGKFMFERLVLLQFWGIYLFLPAIASGAFTVEKERNSLALLMITALSPWQIVLQKLFSRLVPMFTFLLLSFPLMAVAFSFGGVTEDYLWAGVVLLMLGCVQVASLSLMCSAYCRTTAEAFVASYVLLAVFAALFPIATAPLLFDHAEDAPLGKTLMASLFLMVLTGLFLIFARVFLEARAFVPPRNMLLQLFRRLDGFFNEFNQVTGGVVLVRDGDKLPGDEPVAWRETTKKSLGTFRYLFRVLVVLELPILVACQLLNSPGRAYDRDLNAINILLYALWCIAGMMIAVHAASVISSERSRQTLDVLLATPLAGREILVQKFRGVRRLLGVLAVPFLTIFLFECWWNPVGREEYLVESILCGAIYLHLAAWFSLWLGLKMRSQVKSILTALAIIAAWAIVPVGVHYILTDVFRLTLSDSAEFLMSFSPLALIRAIEQRGTPPLGLALSLGSVPLWWGCAANFVLYGSLALWFRHLCLHNADARLGRLG